MKNFKKIVSLICVATLVLSMSVFANIENDEYVDFEFSADKSTVKVGETVTLTLGTTGKTGTVGVTGLWAYVEYGEGLTYVDGTDSFGIGSTDGAMISIEHDGDAKTVDYANFVTIPFVANAVGEYTVALTSCAFLDEDYDGSADDTAEIVITVEADGPTENVATFVKDELALNVDGVVHNFTDVPVYEATTAATSFKLKAVYGEGEHYLKFRVDEETITETIDVSNIKVEGEGEVSFQVAIIGVPAEVVIEKLIVE